MAGGTTYSKGVEQAKEQAKTALAQQQINDVVSQARQQNPGNIPPQNRNGGVMRGISFDAQGNRIQDGKIVSFASQSSYEQYLAQHGVSNVGTVVNPSVFSATSFANLAGYDKGTTGAASLVSPSTSKESISKGQPSPSENYGYTGDVKPSLIIQESQRKNPELVTFEKPTQPRSMGVTGVITLGAAESVFGKTPSKEYGQKDIATSQFTRGSAREGFVKQSEAERAFVPANARTSESYLTGGTPEKPVVTLGKAESFFGKTPSGQYGQKDIGTNQFVRNSPLEQKTQASEALRASKEFPSSTKAGFEPSVLSPTAKSSPSVFQNVSKPSDQISSPVSPTGPKLVVLEFTQGLGFGEGLSGFVGSSPQQSSVSQERDLSTSLYTQASKVGATSVDVYFQGKKGAPVLIESVPTSEKNISSAVNKYSQSRGVFFSVTPQKVESPKQTSIPATVTPLAFGYVSSKDFTGQYFDIKQYAGKRVSNIESKASLPLTTPSDKSIGFGLPIQVPTTAIREAGSETLSLATGFIKATPPLLAGLGTEYYNLITTGKSGGPTVKITSAQTFFSPIVQKVLYPQDIMAKNAVENYAKTSSFIHQNVGVPIREFGITTPQRVQQPKTIGALVGTTVGYGMMVPPEAVPFRIGKIPLRVAPETASPAFPSGLGGERPMVSGSLIFGYGKSKTTPTGEVSYQGRELVSKTASGYKFGQVKPENILPPGFELRAKATRGEEYGTSATYPLSKLSSSDFLKYAETTGRATKGTAETNALLLETKNIINTTGEYKKQEPTLATSTEKVSPIVGKSVLETNATLAGALGKINPRKGSGVQQGSGITKLYTAPKVSEQVFSQLPTQDIDIRVGNPITGNVGGGLFGFSSKEQAISQASTAQKAIEREQAKATSPEEIFRRKQGNLPEPIIQKTKAENAKIIDVKTGEKLVEYTTQTSTEGEIESSLKPQGTIIGKGINYKVYKTPIEGSSLKGVHFGGQYQEETGLSQIMAFQTKGTLAQQGASSEIMSKAGNKFFIGPKAFGEGKEIVRTFGLFKTKALELKSKPETFEQGVKVEKNVARLEEIYGGLYGIDFSKPVKGSDFTPSPSYFKSGAPSRSQSVISRVGGPSNFSIISGRPSTSKSTVSGKSLISSGLSFTSKSSGRSASSKISKSGSSKSSGISRISNISGLSGLSGKSGKSYTSSKSVLSGISKPSSLSSSLISSSSSGLSGTSSTSSTSGFSGLSGKSGGSSMFNFSTVPQTPKTLPKILFGNLGIKRGYKQKEGPTALVNLGVRNIFSGSLDIKVGKGQRYEF